MNKQQGFADDFKTSWLRRQLSFTPVRSNIEAEGEAPRTTTGVVVMADYWRQTESRSQPQQSAHDRCSDRRQCCLVAATCQGLWSVCQVWYQSILHVLIRIKWQSALVCLESLLGCCFFFSKYWAGHNGVGVGGRHSKDNRWVGISVKVTKGPVRQKTSLKAGWY